MNRNDDSWQTRRLQQADVHQLLDLIRSVRGEYDSATRGQSQLEPNDYAIFDVYRHRRSAYFVAIADNHVIGGAGLFPLTNEAWGTCELQRMYLRAEYRGRGIGQSLLNACLDEARTLGYERCYAEAASEMSAAFDFYERNGFRNLATPIGETGQRCNDVRMMLSMGAVSAHL